MLESGQNFASEQFKKQLTIIASGINLTKARRSVIGQSHN
jgi:hypothetical protein